MNKGIAVLCTFLLISGCSSGKKLTVPDVNAVMGDISRQYPNELYLVRSGTGESPEEASEAARFEIVKYFESKISGQTIVSQWAKSRTTRGKTIEEQLTELSNTIIISAEREIPAIDIVKTERVKNSGLYEAWAVLSKSTYSGILNERIQKIDTAVDNRLKTPQETDLDRAGNLARILADLIRREQTRQDLLVVSPVSTVDSRSAVLHAVMTSLDSLVAEALDIGLVFTGEVNDRVKAGIIKGVVDAGIRLKEYTDFEAAAQDNTDLLISAALSVSSRTSTTTISSQEYTLYWKDWILSLNTLEPATRKVIDSLVLSDRTSGKDDTQSGERMVQKILGTQVPAVSSWVYSVIFKPEK